MTLYTMYKPIIMSNSTIYIYIGHAAKWFGNLFKMFIHCFCEVGQNSAIRDAKMWTFSLQGGRTTPQTPPPPPLATGLTEAGAL